MHAVAARFQTLLCGLPELFTFTARRRNSRAHQSFFERILNMANFSKFQQKVIKNYYNNQEAILLQRLGEHITELYLAEGKARAKRWKDIAKVLEKLKIPPTRIETLLKKDDPALLAKLLEELLAKQK